jgi:hypothetical protein
LPSGNSDRTTGPHRVRHVSFLFLRCFSQYLLLLAATMPRTWAEGRALLGSNSSAVPGANTRMGRHDAALRHSGIGTQALNPGGPPAAIPWPPFSPLGALVVRFPQAAASARHSA